MGRENQEANFAAKVYWRKDLEPSPEDLVKDTPNLINRLEEVNEDATTERESKAN